MSSAATASARWCGLVAPTIGAETTGFFSTQAIATCAIDTSRAWAMRWTASTTAWSLSRNIGRPCSSTVRLVGELSTQSDLFRTRWATHNVLQHRGGVKQIHHPVVGELTLTYEALELPADTWLTIMAYSAEPATLTHDALNLLASWAATVDQSDIPV